MNKKAILEFRKINGITECQRCGKELGNTPHHFLCYECWNIQENFPPFDRPRVFKPKQNRNASSAIYLAKRHMACKP